jgi:hypothetical protein
VDLGEGKIPWDELLTKIARARQEEEYLEALAVGVARAAGYSWEAIGVALGGTVTGRQLARRHGAGSTKGPR